MTEQDWKRALELYETASDLPKSVAQALLDSSNEDPAVIDQVCKMLSVTPESEVSAKPTEPHRFAGTAIGRYDVIDLLGRGSTAEVYAGRDRDLGRLVALKIISAEYGNLSSAPQRFMREARASSALNHPNIVTVHELVVWNSLPVIVMELVDGKPLRTLCNTELPFESGTRIGCQMLEALSFAHANGIVHRDLKPENIMVRSDGYVKVLDFGLARTRALSTPGANGAGEGSSTAGLPIGTLRYMSPEQCRGESATPASDVFAAGIVLYEMLAGQHPFYADSALDTAHAIAWLKPTPLRQVNSEIPEAVNSLVMRMLEKGAGARPSSQEAAKSLTMSAVRSARSPKHILPRSKPAYWFYAAISAALVIAIFASWLEKSSTGAKSTPNLREPNLRVTPLASLLGVEQMPDLSPDGARVAFEFSSENDLVSHIYVKDLATSKLTQLTSAALPDSQPVFSPEGSRLAFLRQERGKLDVMLMTSEGGIERKVAELADSRLLLRIISWDATGANLIVSERLGEPEPRVALFAISVVTGGKRQITFPNPKQIDCMPVVSPDGRSLGFARISTGGSGRLSTIPLAAALAGIGENQRLPLTVSDELISCWNWTYDGRSLLVSVEKGGRTNLWRYPPSKGLGPDPPVRVEGLNDEVIQTSVSRLPSRFVYAGRPTQNSGLWSYPIPASAELPKRIIASARMDVDPRFSPDGKNIAFASARSGFGQVDLWISSSDGSNQRQITSFGGNELYSTGSPSWSPDGRWIAFDAAAEPPSRVYVLDVLGGKPRQITDPGTWAGVPSWSSDGHWIYFCSERGGLHNIWKAPVLGGAAVQITHNGGFESFESPGGKLLYYTKYFDKPGLWKMALPNGKEELVPGLEGVKERSWVGCSKGIYFVATSQQSVLEFFRFSSGHVYRVRDLATPPSRTYRGLAVAPNGRSMLYLQVEPGRANIMLVSNFH